jgi:predicted RNA-binding protein YlxR (DUF448 family)
MESVRTCVGCLSRDQASEMVRIVQKSAVLILDVQRNQPGRGAWLHPRLNCMNLALKRKSFGRALRVKDSLDSTGLTESIEQAEKMLAQK